MVETDGDYFRAHGVSQEQAAGLAAVSDASFESIDLLTAIVVYALAARDLYNTVIGKRHPFNYLPDDPFSYLGISQGPMYVGPGVVYYAE